MAKKSSADTWEILKQFVFLPSEKLGQLVHAAYAYENGIPADVDDDISQYYGLFCQSYDQLSEMREMRRERGRKGGNPNFGKGRRNPYYSDQKDNQDNQDNQKDNQKITKDNYKDNQKITTSITTNGIPQEKEKKKGNRVEEKEIEKTIPWTEEKKEIRDTKVSLTKKETKTGEKDLPFSDRLFRESECPPPPTPPPKRETAFRPPSAAEVRAYIAEKGYTATDPEAFMDFYQSKGWFVGKTKMKDWKAAVRNWERTEKERKKRYGNFGRHTGGRPDFRPAADGASPDDYPSTL